MVHTDTSTPFRRWCTCLLLAMVAVGIPLAFLRPERAMDAMYYAGLGAGLLLGGAYLNDRIGHRGLLAGLLLLAPPFLLAFFVERSARLALGEAAFDLGGPFRIAEVAAIVVASVLVLLVRNRLEGRQGGGSRWAVLLASFDFPPKRR